MEVVPKTTSGNTGATASLPVKATVHQAQDWPMVSSIWGDLASQSPYSSFYLGPEWTASWMEIFGGRLRPEIVFFRRGDEPVGACVLVYRRERRGPFTVNRVYLNTAGEDALEETTIELNNLLCLPGTEGPVVEALALHLQERRWDELYLKGFSSGLPLQLLAERFASLRQVRDDRPCFYVDLAQLRQSGAPFLQVLSKNTRQKLRRGMQIYDQMGGLRVCTPDGLPAALDLFDELVELHQATWTRRGKPGAFVAPAKVAFHRAVITRGFARGTVQLLRIATGTETIAVLYNYVWREKVFCHQIGLRYRDDNRLSPGMMANALCIDHYAEAGFSDYDLSAGDVLYKRRLSTGCRTMTWLAIQKRTVKMLAIEKLRRLKHAIRATRWKATDRPEAPAAPDGEE